MPYVRFALSFVLAPLALSVLLNVAVCFPHPWNIVSRGFFFLPMLGITLAHSILLGAPIALRLPKRDSLTLKSAVLSGAIIGVVPLSYMGCGEGLSWQMAGSEKTTQNSWHQMLTSARNFWLGC